MIILVAAVSQNNVIGKKNGIPWYLPEDLKHFKQITTGHIVLMGRKTYESIIDRLGHPLPNRKSVVVTRSADLGVAPGVDVLHSIDEVFKKYTDQDIYVIGGATIYEQTIIKADKLLITQVHKEYEGDVFFPLIDKTIWKEVERKNYEGYSFV